MRQKPKYPITKVGGADYLKKSLTMRNKDMVTKEKENKGISVIKNEKKTVERKNKKHKFPETEPNPTSVEQWNPKMQSIKGSRHNNKTSIKEIEKKK